MCIETKTEKRKKTTAYSGIREGLPLTLAFIEQ